MQPKVIHIRDSTGSEDEVYIGRAGKGNDGMFGNPVIKGQGCFMCGKTHVDGGSTFPSYATAPHKLDPAHRSGQPTHPRYIRHYPEGT